MTSSPRLPGSGSRIRSLLLFLFAMPFLVAPAAAQRDASDIPVVTRAIALEGARIVQAPGRVIETGTVVIRDGRIVAVGENVTVPYDAERIAADSMTVYAAFIDGLSSTGVPQPRPETNLPSVPDPGNPPPERAGIQPERDVREMLSADEDAIGDLREIGFGAAHVVPQGRMLPGSGAVVLLTGDQAGDMVLKGDVSMFAQFQGARGVYPGTPMGEMAEFRHLYRESGRRRLMETRFAEDPAGSPRPEFDEVYYAFFPVIDGEKPVFFFVDDALEIRRALTLQAELGFSLMLGGLNEAFDDVDALKEAGVPLFVTLDLPDKPRWMNRIKRDSVDAILAAYTPETRTATYRDVEAEKRSLEARQLMSRDQYAGVAATLHDAGLRFGFSTMGADADDIRANIRDMVDRGLSEDAALSALTVDAAENLGLTDVLGTVDRGKIANLIVADGPVFGEKTHYAYVFVDGRKYAFEKKDNEGGPAGEGEGTSLLAGTWEFTAFTPDGEQSGTTVFRRAGDGWEGSMSYEDGSGSFDLSDIRFEDRKLSFQWTDQNGSVLSIEGSVSGEEFTGSFSVGGQTLSVTGARTSPNRS